MAKGLERIGAFACTSTRRRCRTLKREFEAIPAKHGALKSYLERSIASARLTLYQIKNDRTGSKILSVAVVRICPECEP